MKINLINLSFLKIAISISLHPSKPENLIIEKDSSGQNIIKIDLDNKTEVELLNPSAVARALGVSPQYAGRVLHKKQSGNKLKERMINLFGIDKHQAA